MKIKFLSLLAVLLLLPFSSWGARTVIANPGVKASNSIRLNWHTDLNTPESSCTFTEASDTKWKKARRIAVQGQLCAQFDSIPSTTPEGKKVYERVRFFRNTVEISNLKPDTKYMYRIDDDAEVRYFKTAPEKTGWTAAVISDFHAYTPLPNRVSAAMGMLNTLEKVNKGDFDFILHGGDITAWGGSYSFWEDLYKNDHFKKYSWAGVIGNHDHMSRGYDVCTNDYFRLTSNYPLNGYEGEEGVCYFFNYGGVLFIMLNNEDMKSDEGLAAAQDWTRKVIKENPAEYVVVMEHYQWFFGTNGKTSQYSRWSELFDECGVDLAISANNHVYARTNALYQGMETDGSRGTVYVQTPSSDNERGQEYSEWTDNRDIIKFRWTEGGGTVGAMLMEASAKQLTLSLYDRSGRLIDSFNVLSKRK